MMASHELSTKGGIRGHVFRRLVHVFFLVFFTLGFYKMMPIVEQKTLLSQPQVAVMGAILVTLIEGIRIGLGWVAIGQREHEKRFVCSAAWSLLGLCAIFYCIPQLALAFAIALTSAVVDPLIGELKRFLSIVTVYVIAVVVSLLLWCCCAFYFSFHFWPFLVLGPLAVLVEYPRWRYFDDNFTMLIFPVMGLLAFSFWGY